MDVEFSISSQPSRFFARPAHTSPPAFAGDIGTSALWYGLVYDKRSPV